MAKTASGSCSSVPVACNFGVRFWRVFFFAIHVQGRKRNCKQVNHNSCLERHPGCPPAAFQVGTDEAVSLAPEASKPIGSLFTLSQKKNKKKNTGFDFARHPSVFVAFVATPVSSRHGRSSAQMPVVNLRGWGSTEAVQEVLSGSRPSPRLCPRRGLRSVERRLLPRDRWPPEQSRPFPLGSPSSAAAGAWEGGKEKAALGVGGGQRPELSGPQNKNDGRRYF